jgi:hypothetical protein
MTTHRRKARRLLQAATLTTKDRAVAQLEQNPTPRLKAIGGGEADSWNRMIGQRLGGALRDSHLPNFVEAARASLDGLIGINPTDPIEGMIYQSSGNGMSGQRNPSSLAATTGLLPGTASACSSFGSALVASTSATASKSFCIVKLPYRKHTLELWRNEIGRNVPQGVPDR